MTTLAQNIHPDLIAKMRKIKSGIPSEVMGVLRIGCRHNPAPLMQFERDVRTYGMWEALLYVEGYEGQYYETGTAKQAALVC